MKKLLFGLFVVIASAIAWFCLQRPSAALEWAEPCARLPHTVVAADGRTVTVENVRDFRYRAANDYEVRYRTGIYDLDEVVSMDCSITRRNGRELFGHIILSFGFKDGRRLAISPEARLEKGERYGFLPGCFRSYELILIAATEEDVFGRWTTGGGDAHGEVFLYPTHTPPATAAYLLKDLLLRANALAEKPEFYNSLTCNSLGSLVPTAGKLGLDFCAGWRGVFSGLADRYGYSSGWFKRLRPDETFEEMRERCSVNRYVAEVKDVSDYSRSIRKGMTEDYPRKPNYALARDWMYNHTLKPESRKAAGETGKNTGVDLLCFCPEVAEYGERARILAEETRVYVPFCRQLMPEDMTDALDMYFARWNQDRRFLLAGFAEAGTAMLRRVMEQYFTRPENRAKLEKLVNTYSFGSGRAGTASGVQDPAELVKLRENVRESIDAAIEDPYELNHADCCIGVMAGCDSETLSRKFFDQARIVPFDDMQQAVLRLLTGKIDGFVYDEHVLRLAQWKYPGRFRLLDKPIDTDPSVIAVAKKRPEVRDKLNGFIADFRRSGLYDQMFMRWCHDPERRPEDVPDLSQVVCKTPGAEQLRVGVDPMQEPNAYLDAEGRLVGYDIEFAYRFGRAAGYRISFVQNSEEILLKLLEGGEIDVVIANLGKDPSRKRILWTDGYLDSDIVMMVRDDKSKKAEE